MAVPVLATKFYIPPLPPKVVARPRLIERLNEGLSTQHTQSVTLISAPAGFGKSTLVSEWLAALTLETSPAESGEGMKAAWLSLEESDSNLARFLIYLIRALQRISPDLGTGILDVLQSAQLPGTESILTALVNEITAIPDGFVLVLDDYHVIDSKPIDHALTFLIEHLPPQMHLVITTREDPAVPIHRLRARGKLIELRAGDLRFTPSEAAGFLNQVMGLNLSEQDVAALEARTEGWIAGLQLAALSVKGSDDVTGFIQAFAGDHRYIVDYLVEEVLQRQPEDIRLFLLQTSILDRLTASLCDAVRGNDPEGRQPSGSRARLEHLQRGNFFLIPLDEKRHWYRYHHLFADVLRMHLMAEQPEEIPVLHQRASAWYEQNGFTADAIRHALAGGDFERAADAIEQAAPAMHRNRQEATVLGWVKALPEELFRARPVLSILSVGTLMSSGDIEAAEARLQDAERWLGRTADRHGRPKDMIVVNEEEFRRLPGSIAMYRAGMALARGDVVSTMNHARQVLEVSHENDDFLRGAASSLLGLASWTSGDLETAHQTYSNGMAHLQKAGFISDVIGGAVTLADIRTTQGRLREARSIYERGLYLATQQAPVLRGAADMYVGMSELYRERNDLGAAAEQLLKSKELGDLNGLPKNPYRWRVAMARLQETRGELDEALDLLEEAERLYEGDFSPNVRPIPALKARIWVAQGQLAAAFSWAREQGLSIADDLSYLREFEHITLARILLAPPPPGRTDVSIRAAIGFLERLRSAAEEGGRVGSLIEILVLQALACQLQDDISAAVAALERALTLAEPEGYARIFLDEGAPMAKLLREAKTRRIMSGYTTRLLTAFDVEQPGGEKAAPRSVSPASSPLVEPLSQRELEVLRLFRSDLSGPEIARELVVALSTIRTHTKSIYSKLGVNSRRAAVRRAEELGLI